MPNQLPFTPESPCLIGMVHLAALPGAPDFKGDMDTVLALAREDAQTLVDAGFNGVMVENYNDVPFFPASVPAVTVAAMSACIIALRSDHPQLPIGVNVLRNDALSALSIAHACGADFIRVNVLTGASVTDQGLIQGRAASLLRTRHAWNSRVAIFADVGVKHAAPLAPIELGQAARDTAYRGRADGLIVSGVATGAATSAADLELVRSAVPDRPLLIGSGVTLDNLDPAAADGFIIGTSIKRGGRVCAQAASALVQRARFTRTR